MKATLLQVDEVQKEGAMGDSLGKLLQAKMLMYYGLVRNVSLAIGCPHYLLCDAVLRFSLDAISIRKDPASSH